VIVIGLLGALSAFALPHAGSAANPKLVATVNDNFTITLTDAAGTAVTTLPAGTYDVEVHDNSAFHSFHLTGPGGVDKATTVPGTGTTTWTVTLVAGSYHFQCDAHPATMNGDFTVTSAGSTGTQTTGTTPPPAPTTTAPAPPPPPPAPPATTTNGQTTTSAETSTSAPTMAARPPTCKVPRVLGRTLAGARRLIAAALCRIRRLTYAYSKRVPRQHVLAQHPSAGARVARGTPVDLVVSRGSPPRVVPRARFGR
jgi:hypothetical protein